MALGRPAERGSSTIGSFVSRELRGGGAGGKAATGRETVLDWPTIKMINSASGPAIATPAITLRNIRRAAAARLRARDGGGGGGVTMVRDIADRAIAGTPRSSVVIPGGE